jgi:predicted amidohydrolase
MPELSMPSAGALEAALSADPGSYPALVIAGSAHESLSDGTRVNEARIYLDGVEVARHRKIHPFLATAPDGGGKKVREAISRRPGQITLLSGSKTRLGVVICADLDDKRIPGLLLDAGANLVLVPSLTDHPGAFNGAICNLASGCQAVAVIANSQLGPKAGERFRVAAAVPRAALGEQSREYGPDPERPLAEAAIFDPNADLPEALEWN